MSQQKHFYTLWVKNEKSVPGGPTHGSQYILDNACRMCGTGAVLTGPHIVSGIAMNLKKDLFAVIDENILISDRVANLLTVDGIDSFGEVLQKRGRRPMPFKYLIPQGELPPFSDRTTGYKRDRPCQLCGRDGYFNSLIELGVVEPLILRYDGVNPALLEKDILITYERFGNGRFRTQLSECFFASPEFVVSERFVGCFRRHKVRRFETWDVFFD